MDEDIVGALSEFQESPGTITTEKLSKVKAFFVEYIEYRDAYKEVFVVDPLGLTLESKLDSVEWYEEYLEQKHKGVE